MSKSDKGSARFHLSDEARKYFERIGVGRNKGKSDSGDFSAVIEPYYLCMIMGIARGEVSEPDPMRPDMIREWASHAKEHDLLISGLVFHQYCRKRGISHDDEGVLMKMSDFFSNDRTGTYEKPAFKMMNEYAQGGFNAIRERIGVVSDLADFLEIYLQELEESL